MIVHKDLKELPLPDTKKPVDYGDLDTLYGYRAIGYLMQQDQEGFPGDGRAGAGTPASIVLQHFIRDENAVLKLFPFLKKIEIPPELKKLWKK